MSTLQIKVCQSYTVFVPVSDWFAFTIASMCFCFIFEGISLIIFLLLWHRTGRFQRKIEEKKQDSLCLLQTATGFTVASGNHLYTSRRIPGYKCSKSVKLILIGEKEKEKAEGQNIA